MNVVRENSVSGRKKRSTSNMVFFYIEIADPPGSTPGNVTNPVDFGKAAPV
jgi:hypothetical protein